MNKLFKSSTLIFGLSLGLNAFADISWKPYSAEAVSKAQSEGKTVVLGFHKKGCGTCETQDAALSKAGLDKAANVVSFNVERKDSSLNNVYEMYGFNKRQWAAIVALKDGKEIARLEPGTTDEAQIKSLVAKVTK